MTHRTQNIPTTSYELPDGQTLEIGADRFKVPDVMFNPSIVQTIPGMEKREIYRHASFGSRVTTHGHREH